MSNATANNYSLALAMISIFLSVPLLLDVLIVPTPPKPDLKGGEYSNEK